MARFGLIIAVTAAPANAHANGAPQRARLVYALDADAARDCPDTRAMRRSISERLGYDPFWEWAPTTIVVQIWRERAEFAGRVIVVDATARSTTRELPADTDCRELGDAAALAISIALDIAPQRGRRTEAIPAPPPPVPPPSPGPPPDAAAAPSSPPPPPRRPFATRRRGLAAGGTLSAVTGVAPKPGIDVAAFVEVVRASFALSAELHAEQAAQNEQLQVASGMLVVAPCLRMGPTFGCALGEMGWAQAWSVGAAASSTAGGAPIVRVGGRAGAEVELTGDAFFRVQGDFAVEAYGPRFGSPGYVTDSGRVIRSSSSVAPSVLGGAVGVGVGVYFR